MSSTGATVNIGSAVTTTFKGDWKLTAVIGFCVVLFVSLFVASIVQTSRLVGSKDDWNVIQPQITNVLVLSLIGIAALTVAVILYFIQDPSMTMYFVIIATMLSLGLSYSAVAIAAITKSS
jgi:hypothetical protein